MDAGKLDTRVEIVTQTKTEDGYGGFTSTEEVTATFWASVIEAKGDVGGETTRRGRYLYVDIVIRDKTIDEYSINRDTIFKIQSEEGKYRVIGMFESYKNKFVKISATKLD
jgi:hypothetical protein